jgi:YnbE-like lipoprotein
MRFMPGSSGVGHYGEKDHMSTKPVQDRMRNVVVPLTWYGKLRPAMAVAVAASALAACTPTVKVEAPDKPIVINLNVKIEQEVRVKIDRDVEELLKSNPDLF